MTTRRQVEARPAVLARVPERVRLRFLQEVVSELRKVVWPSREEATRLTVMVLFISVAVGALLGVLDIGFSVLIRKVFVNPFWTS